MARDRATTTPTSLPASGNLGRRALLTLGVPVLGAAGLAAALPRRAGAREGGQANDTPSDETDLTASDETGLTAHRKAYYDRARF